MTKQQILLLALAAWDTLWKGLALWKAAQRKEKNWFIFMLILNTLGILPMIYLFVRKPKEQEEVAEVEIIEAEIIETERRDQ